MRVSLLSTALVLSLIGTSLPITSLQAQDVIQASKNAPEVTQTPGSFADLAEHLLPAVVNISSTQKAQSEAEIQDMPAMPGLPEGSPFEHFFEEFMDRRIPNMPMEPQASLGSGFIIDAKNGYIITNNHVVKDAEEVRVTFHDDETVDAEIIGHDEKTDIAVLKVDTKGKSLTEVHLGDSDAIRVGDWILAIGNPFGLGGTVTAGIISARARDISSGPYDDFLQTDASINRGNSGGPMFNLKGEVIGINTAIFSPSGGSIGIGFAIPSALAKTVINQIIEYGRTRRGWLGVRIQHVTEEIAESLGLEEPIGALVASVTPDGPSEKAGLMLGDIILELNGKKVKEMRELPRLVAETPIDSEAKITYWRDGKKRTTTVHIGELEKAEETGLITQNDTGSEQNNGTAGQEIEELGITVAKLSDALRSQFGVVQNAKGLLITAIEPRSQAAQKGLFEGDVIEEVNQAKVEEPADLQKAIKKAQKAGRSSILMLINRDGDSRFIAIKIDDQE